VWRDGLKRWGAILENSLFLKSDLLQLTPHDICCYFNIKAFGTLNLGDDCVPKFGRSSSLMYDKKSISFFMPNKLTPWNIDSASGNPTKSIEVNEIVKRVQKMEVRKQKKKSNKETTYNGRVQTYNEGIKFKRRSSKQICNTGTVLISFPSDSTN
jgi:hypothetical protein